MRASKARCVCDDLQSVGDGSSALGVGQLETHHAAPACHQTLAQVMVRMLWQTWMMHRRDSGMLRETMGECLCGVALGLNP